MISTAKVNLLLHAHLPYVRHLEYPSFLEEDWLFEALHETYIPLLIILEDLDRRFNTLKELGDAHPIKRTIVNRSVRHTIANYDLKQARKDSERLDDERRKVRSIISEIKKSEEFENEYFGIELDADETLSDCLDGYHDYIMDYEEKLSDELVFGFVGERKNKELEKELEEFLRKIRE